MGTSQSTLKFTCAIASTREMRFVREADDDIAEKLDEDCDHRFRGCNNGFRCRGAGLRHAGYCD